MSDLVDELCDLLEEAQRNNPKFRVVFWVCPAGCTGSRVSGGRDGMVTWAAGDDNKRIPTCTVCGAVGEPR